MVFKTIDNEIVIEKNENLVVLEFNIPPSCGYFDGHFPGFPILPAVAQIELAVRFASRYFGISAALSEIKKVKFSNLIQPCTPLRLKLEKKDKVISFGFISPNDGTVYSKGTVIQEEI